MSIVRYYNPYRNARRFRTLTNDFFGGSELVKSPAVDIAETDDEYIFELALPGFTKDEISIEASYDELTIEARKTEEKVEGNMDENGESGEMETSVEEIETSNKIRYIRKERQEASYRRSFSFNKPINPSNADVNLENGILTITVAKAEETKPVKLMLN